MSQELLVCLQFALFFLCIVARADGLISPEGLSAKCFIRSHLWLQHKNSLFVFLAGMYGKTSLPVSHVSLLHFCLMLLASLGLVWQEFTAERSHQSTLMIKSSGLLMLCPVLCNSWVCSQWVILAHVLTGIFNLCGISGMMQAGEGCLCLSQASFTPTVLALDVCLIWGWLSLADLYLAMATENKSMLILLDLSTVLDVIDNEVLLTCGNGRRPSSSLTFS